MIAAVLASAVVPVAALPAVAELTAAVQDTALAAASQVVVQAAALPAVVPVAALAAASVAARQTALPTAFVLNFQSLPVVRLLFFQAFEHSAPACRFDSRPLPLAFCVCVCICIFVYSFNLKLLIFSHIYKGYVKRLYDGCIFCNSSLCYKSSDCFSFLLLRNPILQAATVQVLNRNMQRRFSNPSLLLINLIKPYIS